MPEINKEYIDKINKNLDQYEHEICMLPQVQPETPKALNYTLEEIKKKDTETLAELGYDLAKYGFFIQQKINRQKAWQKWCYSKLNEVAAVEIEKLDTRLGYNERELIAKNKPEICKTLNAYIRKISMNIEVLHNTPIHIKNISDAIRDIRFTRGKHD